MSIPPLREEYIATNATVAKTLIIYDIPNLPPLRPKQSVNLLQYGTLAQVTSSVALNNYIKTGLITITPYIHTHDDKANVGHLLASHGDTNVTGEQLNTLAGGRTADASALHAHVDITTYISNHISTTSNVHGISDTSNLAFKNLDINQFDGINFSTQQLDTAVTNSHAKFHNISSHIDTDASGAQLSKLVGGGNVDDLHKHNYSMVNHNDVQNIQGGSTDSYYHLTNDDYTELTQWLDNVVLSSDGSLNLVDGRLYFTADRCATIYFDNNELVFDLPCVSIDALFSFYGDIKINTNDKLYFGADKETFFYFDGDNLLFDIKNPSEVGTFIFNVFPQTPQSAPSYDYEVANKKYVDDAIVTPHINHNDTLNIQGGAVAQYYHLDLADYTELTNWMDIVVLSSDGSLNLANGHLYFTADRCAEIYFENDELVFNLPCGTSDYLFSFYGDIKINTDDRLYFGSDKETFFYYDGNNLIFDVSNPSESGTLIFDVFPQTPQFDPFYDYDVANKQYVDNSASNINHNDTLNIQGGSAAEYYHFNAADYTELTQWLDDVILSNGGDVDLVNGDLTAIDVTIKNDLELYLAGTTTYGLININTNTSDSAVISGTYDPSSFPASTETAYHRVTFNQIKNIGTASTVNHYLRDDDIGVSGTIGSLVGFAVLTLDCHKMDIDIDLTQLAARSSIYTCNAFNVSIDDGGTKGGAAGDNLRTITGNRVAINSSTVAGADCVEYNYGFYSSLTGNLGTASALTRKVGYHVNISGTADENHGILIDDVISGTANYAITIDSDTIGIWFGDDQDFSIYCDGTDLLFDNPTTTGDFKFSRSLYLTGSSVLYYNDTNTGIWEDVSSNLTFKDAVAGTLTLDDMGKQKIIYITEKVLYGDPSVQIESIGDDTHWAVDEAIIKSISVRTDSTDWSITIYCDTDGNSGIFSNIILANNLSGPQVLVLDLPYIDNESSQRIHLDYNDNTGDALIAHVSVTGVAARV